MTQKEFDLEKIRSEKILSGTLHWHKKSGATVIGNCGDLANIALIEKLHVSGAVLSLDSFADDELIKKHIDNFQKLKECENENSRAVIRKEIIKDFSDVYINNAVNGSHIDWWQICYQSFYDLPEDFENHLAGNSLVLYKRAVAVSSLTVLLALSFGYLNYHFLKDLYNGVFVTDLELMNESRFSPHTFSKLERGRTLYLDESISSFYISQSYYIKENLKSIGIKNDAIYHMLKFHHERLDTGSGPYDLYESEVGDLPTLYSLVQKIFPYSEYICSENDARGVLMNIFKSHKRFIKMKKLFEVEFKRTA